MNPFQIEGEYVPGSLKEDTVKIKDTARNIAGAGLSGLVFYNENQ